MEGLTLNYRLMNTYNLIQYIILLTLLVLDNNGLQVFLVYVVSVCLTQPRDFRFVRR